MIETGAPYQTNAFHHIGQAKNSLFHFKYEFFEEERRKLMLKDLGKERDRAGRESSATSVSLKRDYDLMMILKQFSAGSPHAAQAVTEYTAAHS